MKNTNKYEAPVLLGEYRLADRSIDSNTNIPASQWFLDSFVQTSLSVLSSDH
jgi:hypothetical protein